MKAMVLAAGRGSRLKPLTNDTPKPLLPIGDHSLIEYNLFSLKRAGVQDVIINVCHHARKIIDRLGNGSRYGLNIEYSYENGTTLGTGGGIFQALTLLGNDPFIVISADICCQFDFGLSFMNAKSDVHLVLVENPIFNPDGDYSLTQEGVVTLSGDRTLTYAGIAKIHPRLFVGCQSGNFSLAPILNDAITRGVVSGERFAGPWFNVGTLEELNRLQAALKEGRFLL